ncbi:MAG: hypothetical protein LV473_14235 [Nitrospira sp.]|nr:hypothetical protein [Nitrospira sp.]
MTCPSTSEALSRETASIVDAIAKQNVLRVVQQIRRQSQTLDNLARERRIAIIGAMYDVATGDIEFLVEDRLDEVVLPKIG